MSRAVVTVVLLAALAGCGAPSLADPTPTDRVTAAPVPEPAAPTLAPGLTTAGVADPVALKDAHIARLQGGDFRLRRVRVERDPNGTLVSRTNLTAAYPGDGRYIVVRTFAGPTHNVTGTAGSRIEYGGANTTVRLRRAPDGTVRSRVVRPPPTDPVPRSALLTAPYSGRTILLAVRGVEVDAVTRVGDRVRVSGAGVADRAALRSLLSPTLVQRLRDVRLTALVGAEGLVRRLGFGYTVALDGRLVTVSLTVEYTDVGSTTLAEPAWAATATWTTADGAFYASGVRSTTVPSHLFVRRVSSLTWLAAGTPPHENLHQDGGRRGAERPGGASNPLGLPPRSSYASGVRSTTVPS